MPMTTINASLQQQRTASNAAASTSRPLFHSVRHHLSRPHSTSLVRPVSAASNDSTTSSSSTPSRPLSNPALKTLQTLRGVGPVNANLLQQYSISSVDRLQEIYHVACKKDRQEFQLFLSTKVGFRNPAHIKVLAEHLEDLPWEPMKPKVKLAVEGNIGAGKSTFLDIMRDGQLELQDIIEVIPEPVEEWQKVKNGEDPPINLLERFYKDPHKYAYTFQHYVLLTRMQKDRAARASQKPLQVLERSIFSDRMVFVRAMHEAGYMGDLELSLYDSWFSMETSQDRGLTPDGFIYLKARPETCIKRLRNRNRSEEVGVDAAYLENLHDKHESWLHFGAKSLQDGTGLVQTKSRLRQNSKGLELSPPLAAASTDGRRLSVGAIDNFTQEQEEFLRNAPASIRDSVVFLGGDEAAVGGTAMSAGNSKVKSMLAGIPALVIDHEQEDILYDSAAREDYAKKVKDFSDFVGQYSQVTGALELKRNIGLERGVSGGQLESMKELIAEYRKFAQLAKKTAAPTGGTLHAFERHLESLSRDPNLLLGGLAGR